MILRNYDNIMTARRLTVYNYGVKLSTDTEHFTDGHINVKGFDGVMENIWNGSTGGGLLPLSAFKEYANQKDNSLSNGVSNLVCGGGNTDVNGNVGVSYDDYELAEIFSTLQVEYIPGSSKCEKVYNADGSWTSTYSRIMTNISGEMLTVKEIGVFSGFPFNSSSFDSCLTYRKVLDTPIEVPAGANFVLSFTTTVSANPNKPADYDASASVE